MQDERSHLWSVSRAEVQPLLTASEVSKVLRVSVGMVHKMRRSGRLLSVPGLGRCVRFRSDAVQALVAGRPYVEGSSRAR